MQDGGTFLESVLLIPVNKPTFMGEIVHTAVVPLSYTMTNLHCHCITKVHTRRSSIARSDACLMHCKVNGGHLPPHVAPFCIGGAFLGVALPLFAAALDWLVERMEANVGQTSRNHRLVGRPHLKDCWSGQLSTWIDTMA